MGVSTAPIASDEPVTAQLAGYRPRWSPVGMLARARCAHRGTCSARGRPLRGLGSSDHETRVFARIFVIISILAISAGFRKGFRKIVSSPVLAEREGGANPCRAERAATRGGAEGVGVVPGAPATADSAHSRLRGRESETSGVTIPAASAPRPRTKKKRAYRTGLPRTRPSFTLHSLCPLSPASRMPQPGGSSTVSRGDRRDTQCGLRLTHQAGSVARAL